MHQTYVETHWEKFKSIIPMPQGETGDSPVEWVRKFDLKDVPDGLPNEPLSREKVLGYCQDTKRSVLFGYICAMAWGGQGAVTGGAKHVTDSWSNRTRLEDHLEVLREGKLLRWQAYNLFVGEGKIPGLGPAFWTKLLFFFGPKDKGVPYSNDSMNCYIMDQWTAKSVNLLAGIQVARTDGVHGKCGSYQAFCEEIDNMANMLNLKGSDVEARLFSKGAEGRKEKPWPWRAHVKTHCDYDANILRNRYPHINKKHF